MEGMRYEELLRKAFGFAANGLVGDRSCDPADLAEASLLSDAHLPSAKIGAGYAFAILATAAINEVADRLPDGEYDRLHGFLDRAIKSKSAKELSEVIEDFEETVVGKYFDLRSGAITLKK